MEKLKAYLEPIIEAITAGLTVVFVAKMDTNNTREAFFEFYSNTNSARGFFFNYGFNEASTNHQLDDTTVNLMVCL
jgi:hypothetical protein